MAIDTNTAPAALAKGALRRLVQAQLEPTPENFARAYAVESGAVGLAPPRPRIGVAWPTLIERLVRNLERGGKQWTAARRKESLHHVLESSRSDEERLGQRLQALLQAWEGDRPLEGLDAAAPPTAATPSVQGASATRELSELLQTLSSTVCAGLGEADSRASSLARRLAEHTERVTTAGAATAGGGSGMGAEVVANGGATAGDAAAAGAALVAVCVEARRWFGQRHELMRQLSSLATEMSQGLIELSEEESWSRGQCEALRLQLAEPLDVKHLRDAGATLADTRTRQSAAKRERQAARAALKQLLAGMIGEVGALQQQAGGFESAIERHATAVEAAESLEGLTSVVQEMLADSRRIRAAVGATHERLHLDSERAAVLEARVRDLEGELGRLSEQASTDALTQVANRRGLERLFAEECARAVRAEAPLAVGLIDVDNFKKLNDRLGHAAGDQALKALAAAVCERLRPEDHVARFGGEEFVVLLGGLALEQAQQLLNRLQRSLSASLFLHEGEEVFVTFSAGVTLWRAGEALEATIERADAGLYEAKRSGKNRTCTV
jgi:diguanylate cyclase